MFNSAIKAVLSLAALAAMPTFLQRAYI